jgi:hypothetical protein
MSKEAHAKDSYIHILIKLDVVGSLYTNFKLSSLMGV